MDHEEDCDDYAEEDYVPDDLYEVSMFPPKSEDWYLIPTTLLPAVTIDIARTKLWDHGKKEIGSELRDKYRHKDVSIALLSVR